MFDAFTAGDALEPGFNVMDLSNAGVGYAMDDNNAALITEDMQAALTAAEASIIAGDIMVQNYNTDETCDALDF